MQSENLNLCCKILQIYLTKKFEKKQFSHVNFFFKSFNLLLQLRGRINLLKCNALKSISRDLTRMDKV
jgi:hypothetical protein